MIITPDVILDRMSQRLRTKAKRDDLYFLMCSNRLFEKWLQCELVLSFSGEAISAIYDKNEQEIRSTDDLEQICDVSTEYEISDARNKYRLRVDVCIAEEPFLLEFVNKTTWKIFAEGRIQECIDKYQQAKFHYIELKHFPWARKGSEKTIADLMVNDLKKYYGLDGRTFRSYLPKTIIALCCVSFTDPHEAGSIILKAKKEAKSKVSKFFDKVSFNSVRIDKYIHMLMLYYKY